MSRSRPYLAVEGLGDSPVAGGRRIIGVTGHMDAGFGRHRDAVFLKAGDPLPQLIGGDGAGGPALLLGSRPVEPVHSGAAPALENVPVAGQRKLEDVPDHPGEQKAVFQNRNSRLSHAYDGSRDLLQLPVPAGPVQEQVGGVHLAQIDGADLESHALGAPLDSQQLLQVHLAVPVVAGHPRRDDSDIPDSHLPHVAQGRLRQRRRVPPDGAREGGDPHSLTL